ncbi:MAG: membrane protein insertion efficiency factor YidD [Candidatus Accumulibacter sp.]|uniref:membrane protein insertion efficiency factor YidD n=1 Tax=Accumulibacter sp. TaxID=2053492 RepID=UPI002878FCB9|nr:membrane protein insertion efficiency factor YidD [Accumulibacter sp.]MDS4015339.1 membrane protein insertion efficiency factor YidD [Accumulibacter sp.]
MRSFVLAAITAYQRFVSPYKGFSCAYRRHTGRASCSALGWRAVRRYGVTLGLAVLRRRLSLCGIAHRRHCPTPARPHRAQRGDCDLGCDLPCDLDFRLGSGRACSTLGELVSCCDCGSCDWPERRKKRTREEQFVHLPPCRNDERSDRR